MDRDVLRSPHQLVRQGPAKQLTEEAAMRAPDHDLSDILELGKTKKFRRQIAAGQRLGLRAECFGELHGVVPPPARGVIEIGAGSFHRDRDPGRIHQVGKALGCPYDRRGNRIGSDAGQNALTRRPRPFDGLRLHARNQIDIDALGRAPQRQFAQSGQILRFEKALDSARGGVLDIDFSFRQAPEQFVGRKIDQDNLVGLVEYRIRHGLAHAHLGDLQHHIVEAFEVLDIERGPHVDAGGQQFIDVLPALGVAATRHVGVGVFVHQQQARPAPERRVEVEFLHDLIAVDNRIARENVKALNQLLGLAPAMGLNQTRHDIAPARFLGAGGGEHGKGLTNARRGAEKNLQVPAPLLLGQGKQGVR